MRRKQFLSIFKGATSLRAGSHLGAHARKAKSEFKRERSGGEESGEEARIRCVKCDLTRENVH